MSEQTSSANSAEHAASPDDSELAIIADFWDVPDGSQAAFMDALVAVFERLRQFDGFLDGQILEGVNPGLFVTYARMRSAQARDAAMADGELRAMTRQIGGLASASPHGYSIARSFTPAAP